MFVNLLGTTQKHEASVNYLHDVITWEAQTFSLQTPAANTTENLNWHILEEKEKLYSEERARLEETRKIVHLIKRASSVAHSSLIEKNSVTIIP